MLRFQLVDYLHLVYQCMAVKNPMSCVVMVDGVPETFDTTVTKITSSSVWKFSGYGKHPMGVFLEGGAPLRKAYFSAVDSYKEWYNGVKAGTIDGSQIPKPAAETESSYKAGRTGLSTKQRKCVNMTIDRFVEGNLSCYRVPGYEADDLIWTAYKQLRTQFPDAYIDIFTGDMDMLPLVDDKTSVYMRGTRTWAEPMCGTEYCSSSCEGCVKYAEDSCKIRREFRNYFQVTPKTWDEFISYRSAFKGYNIPYNSVYLLKMLKGDSSDNVPAVAKGYGAKKWNSVIEKMIADGVRFDLLFRYDTPWSVVQPVLLNYFTPEEVAFMYLNAEGIRPRSNMADLINLMPYPNDKTTLDIPAFVAMFRAKQNYSSKSYGDYTKSIVAFNALMNGVDLENPVTLLPPTVPDLGYFQSALNKLRVNLGQHTAEY